jgi:carbonic anhydrase
MVAPERFFPIAATPGFLHVVHLLYQPRPMGDLSHLIENNRAWAARILADNPTLFADLAIKQDPEYMWIGCADSRVPADDIVGLPPGELFVHRNIANVVLHSDLNCMSVIQFAVDHLKVKHILVVGHYGCAGVAAALTNRRMGLADNWLRHVQDIRLKHATHLETFPEDRRADRLSELNVIEQVVNVCQSTVVRDAWDRGQDLTVHGWTYSVRDGLINDPHISIANPDEIRPAYDRVLSMTGRS